MTSNLPAATMSRWQLTEHTDSVRALCWLRTPDHVWLVSGSLDGTARLWDLSDVSSGQAPVTASIWEGHGGAINAIVEVRPENAVSSARMGATERWVATGSADRSIIVWRLSTRQMVAQAHHCHDLGVCCLAPVNDGAWLASGSADATIKLWDLSTTVGGMELVSLVTMRGHTGAVHALASLDANGWIASGSADNSLRVWRMEEEHRDDDDSIEWSSAQPHLHSYSHGHSRSSHGHGHGHGH
jgi:WD40 repeat protein